MNFIYLHHICFEFIRLTIKRSYCPANSLLYTKLTVPCSLSEPDSLSPYLLPSLNPTLSPGACSGASPVPPAVPP